MIKMDKQTQALYEEWKERNKGQAGIPWPQMKIEMHIRHSGNSFRNFEKEGYLKIYHIYKEQGKTDKSHGEYAEAYKILAFTIFGYGNWSNNDRRRKGLSSIRSDWYGK